MRTLSLAFVASLLVFAGCDASGPDGSVSASADAKEIAGELTPIFDTPSSLGDYCVGTYLADPSPASNWTVLSGAALMSSSSGTVTIETDGGNSNPLVRWISSGSNYDDTIPRNTSHCLTLQGPTQVGEFCNVEYYVSKPGTVYPYPSINWGFDRDIYVNGPGSYGYPRSLSFLTDDSSFTITVTTPVGTLTKSVTVSSQYGCP